MIWGWNQQSGDFLKEVLSRNEEDPRRLPDGFNQKRHLNNEANFLDVSDVNRKVLLDDVKQLEMLRQQLLTVFLGQQSLYQALITAEQELLKRVRPGQ